MVWRWFLFIVGLILIVYVVRSVVLLKRSRALFGSSGQFTKDYYVGNAAHPPMTYVILGDSTAVGAGASRLDTTYPYQIAETLAQKGRLVHVLNYAVSGARIADVATKQLPQIGDLKPDIITLTIGANDATHFTSDKSYVASLEQLMAQFQQHSSATVLMANSPHMDTVPAFPLLVGGAINSRVRQQNSSLKRQIESGAFVYIDLYNQAVFSGPDKKQFYASDWFHLSDKGYRVWAQVFQKAISDGSI